MGGRAGHRGPADLRHHAGGGEGKARLQVAPEVEGAYDPKTARWTGDMGAHGFIEYTAHSSVVRVAAWRIQAV